MEKIIIKIPLLCRSKKNSQEIIYNKSTKRPMIIQSKLYRNFELECGYYLLKYKNSNISQAVNLKCLFYVPDKKKRDLTNLENAIADVLVHYKVLEDDNYNIIQSWDGSRILYEKGRSEIIIEITQKG